MGEISKVYVGLDVHQESIAIAQAASGREPARLIGEITHDVNRLVKKLRPLGDPAQVHVVYEAGPTGYGLQRKLQALGYPCEIIAPSLIPRRAGDRVKTDRRDCLRHDVRYPGKTAWTKTFGRWLATLGFDAVGSQIAFTEYCLAVQACDARVERLSMSLLQAIQGWRFERVVKAPCALRGIDVVSAIGLVAEIGDIARFDHPRKLMGYLGLVPSERSSGERVNRGPITKSGNAHARRLLTEAAWCYRFKPRVGYQAQRRQEALPESTRAIAWKAQLRLSERYAKLRARGVTLNKGCVAVARELAGFVWAVACNAAAHPMQAPSAAG